MRFAHAPVIAVLIACGHSHRGGGVGDAPPAGSDAARGSDAAQTADGAQTTGKVACGTTSCPATPYTPANGNNDNYCCLPQSNVLAPTCVHGNLGTCESGNPWYCAQAADCNAGLVCCEAFRAGMFACYPPAMCGAIQACGTTAECINGESCTPRTCGETSIATCGPLTAQQATQLYCM